MKFNKNLPSGLLGLFAVVGVFLFLPVSALAGIPVDSLKVSSSIGTIQTIGDILKFAANLFKYVGWAGVVISILAVVGLLIYKLIGTDDESTMKTVQAGMVKAVIVAVLGILLVSAGFFVSFVKKTLPGNVITPTVGVPTQLD